MIAFLLSPVARWIAGAAVVVAILGSIYAKGRIDGRTQAIEKIEAANRASETKADAAERNVMSCPPGKWNKEARKCEP